MTRSRFSDLYATGSPKASLLTGTVSESSRTSDWSWSVTSFVRSSAPWGARRMTTPRRILLPQLREPLRRPRLFAADRRDVDVFAPAEDDRLLHAVDLVDQVEPARPVRRQRVDPDHQRVHLELEPIVLDQLRDLFGDVDDVLRVD